MSEADIEQGLESLELRLSGVVQGVGMRPFIYRLSQKHGLSGRVYNSGSDVVIHWQGTARNLREAISCIENSAPTGARINRIARQNCTEATRSDFQVGPSHGRSKQQRLMPDRASCPRCVDDIFNTNNRRHHYAFTNCTDCGPRYSVIEQLPWDRANTTLVDFLLCERCQHEYNNPEDRRFHAQPNACPDCGPQLFFTTGDVEAARGSEALKLAAQQIREGRIIAIQGTGCFHLSCDASNSEAIARLRKIKARPTKALAIMVGNIHEAGKLAYIDPAEAKLLSSPAAPIVLLEQRPNTLSPSLAPGLNRLGIMLAHSPLHHLLLSDTATAIVLSSANRPGRPAITDPEEAKALCAELGIAVLWHNRRIAHRIDDSVTQVIDGVPQIIRRARGYAPLPISLPEGFESAPSVLALGGHHKNSICITDGQDALLSGWIGDLDSPAARIDYRSQIDAHCALHKKTPTLLASDQHPDYYSSCLSGVMAAEKQLTQRKVWHHHAHAASCLADNSRPLSAPPILCICFDGTGLGEDTTLWGGEFLLADYTGFTRLASLQSFALAGGESAILQPWRSLAALLYKHLDRKTYDSASTLFAVLKDKPLDTIAAQIEAGLNCPATSSIGRLFDAVAACLGIAEVSYEGEAAMRLQALAEQSEDNESYTLEFSATAYTSELSTHRLWLDIGNDIRRSLEPAAIARRFHNTLANAILRVSESLYSRSSHWQERSIALSGGVFQNALLQSLSVRALSDAGFEVLTHKQVPANDGGLALGQTCIVAAQELRRSQTNTQQYAESTPTCV